jgi:hypothetical protein
MAVLADQHSRCLATAQEDESLLNYSQGTFFWSLKMKMGRLVVVILLLTVTGTGSSGLGPPAQP